LHHELWHLYEPGLPTPDILRAATITPAMAHQMLDRGAIKTGMRADLLLLQPDADPIAAINDTMKISRLWNGGLEFKKVIR
jgi:imidazolonepropionase-like amidohydrolase